MNRRGRRAHPDVLTPAEWRVVEGVRHGLTNPQIAARLGVSLDAVKYHVGNGLAKLGLASRRQLRQWPGVRRDSALHAKEMPMNAPLTALGQVARTVSDVAAARQWYAEVLGLPHLYTFGSLSFFDLGGVRLVLSQSAPGVAAAADSLLYFRVADVRAAQAELAARGVAFTHAPHRIHTHADGTEEWMAFFTDPEGRPLALMAQVPAP